MSASVLPIRKEFSESLEWGTFGDVEDEGFQLRRWELGEGTPRRIGFQSETLVLCLNIAGRAELGAGAVVSTLLEPGTIVLSSAARARQHLQRISGERHRFVTIELGRAWLKKWLTPDADALCEPVRRALKPGRSGAPATEVRPMSVPQAQLAAEMMQPPRERAVARCWHHAKVMELLAHVAFQGEGSELFCDRTKRAGRERILRVQEILQGDLENPPALAELGRIVGCSPFYLSRMFRQETGVTISAYLRRLRMDRAAELIRAGEANVTEAAMTVGYSSLSHFSKAFAETFGCCPCLYGRKG